MFLVFDSIPDWYKTQEMCVRVVSKDQTIKFKEYKTKECVMKLL